MEVAHRLPPPQRCGSPHLKCTAALVATRRVVGSNGTVAAIELRGVFRTFDVDTTPVRALRAVDLQVDDGELLVLTGPSGCGKSSLVNIVAGLDRPDKGEVWVAGHRLDAASELERARLRRRHVGLVFQFFNLLEGLSALENVSLAAALCDRSRRQAEARALELLDVLGIRDKAATPPGLLSGGQRQRLAIARALVNEPTVLLADEPTGALDTDGTHEIVELFRRLHADGQAILLVTHDPEVAKVGERVVTMLDGQVAGGLREVDR